MHQEILKTYGGRVRVRVMGFLKTNHEILLIKHAGLTDDNAFWSLPGGGVEDKLALEDTLKKEFLEETGLKIEVVKFLNSYEFISEQMHAFELIYEVKTNNIEALSIGNDPETVFQTIRNLQMIPFSEIKKLNVHPFIKQIQF